eukprot:5505902-Amphidinium_carterae.1
MAYCNVNDPFAHMGRSTRGYLLADFCQWYDGIDGRLVVDALPTADVNGRQLSRRHRLHDYSRKGVVGEPLRRVEVKSARLLWNECKWAMRFYNVKLG